MHAETCSTRSSQEAAQLVAKTVKLILRLLRKRSHPRKTPGVMRSQPQHPFGRQEIALLSWIAKTKMTVNGLLARVIVALPPWVKPVGQMMKVRKVKGFLSDQMIAMSLMEM